VFRKIDVVKSSVVSIIVSAALMSVGGCSGVRPVKTAAEDSQRRSATPFLDRCTDVFKTFVNARGMVDYAALKQHTDELDLLLEEFGQVEPGLYRSWSKEDEVAFWIDVYNLQKLKVVVDNYPITPSSRILASYWGPRNIRHVEGKIVAHAFRVMGETFTFAELENRFFRDQFDDPRVFFALTSASLSSPPLRDEPYYGHRLDEQLDDQVGRFLASPLAFRIEREKQIVYLSAMFEVSSHGKAFAEKFATNEKFKAHRPTMRAALNFISHYISPDDRSFLEVGDYSVKFMQHDWTINDAS